MSFLRPDASDSELIYSARSKPVRIRFKETYPRVWEGDMRVVSTFYGDRELCYQYLGPEVRRMFYSARFFDEPVPLLMIAELSDWGLTGWLYAEIESPEPYEVPAVRVPLGLRNRKWTRMRYPDNPERETRDFLLSLLQGDPEAAIEDLVRSVAWAGTEGVS